MGRGRLLGGCAWLLGGLALLQTLYLRALPPPAAPRAPRAPRAPPRGVLDASGSFRVFRDVLGPPPGWAIAPRPELVLATHGTPGRAAAAILGGGRWGGPLSVAVFGVPREGLEELMAVLGGPCRGLRDRLRLHVVLGAAGPPPPAPRPPARAPSPHPGGCRGALGRLAAADPPSYDLGVPYPGNLLRNVAWEGAAGTRGASGGPPPQFGGRFVLLVDADVEPSPGLREGFLELLRDGGLHPKNWGTPGNFGDPKTWGDPGGLRDPKTWGAPEGLHSKTWGALGDLGDPKALGAPGGLRVPNTSRVPSVLGGPHGLEDPKGPHDPNVPRGPRDPGVPNALEDPTVLNVPNTLEVPKGLQNPGVPHGLEDPNALKVPKGPRDPGVPNALEDPNTLQVPNAPKVPNAPDVPNPSDVPVTAEPPWARVVFVLPAFEVRSGLRPPGSKAELLRLWDAGDARPFYSTLCPRCQAPTAFGRWRALPPPPRLRVAYEAPWRDPWEPFYVAPARGVPPFDERFLQYGFNRISQACELHVAGFRFAVLDGAFVAHRGFKEPGGFHGGREAELGLNRGHFREFRAELRRRYPSSGRRC